MAKKQTITTKYGTRIDVTGLTPEQIAKVKSTAEDKGAYGSKGAALAKTFQKQNSAKAPRQGGGQGSGQAPAAPQGPVVPEQGDGTGYNGPAQVPGSGAPEFQPNPEPNPVNRQGNLDIPKAINGQQDLSGDAARNNFLYNNPGNQTDTLGNQRSIKQNPDGSVTITDQAGQTQTMARDAFIKSIGGQTSLDLSGDISNLQKRGPLDLSGAPQVLQTGDVRQDADRVAEANYRFLTRNNARDKKQELADLEQNLADRGIPRDSKEWNRELTRVEEKYQNLDNQAQDRAIASRNDTLSTEVGAQTSARNAFIEGALGEKNSDIADFNAITGARTTQHQAGIGDIATLGGVTNSFNPNFTPYQGAQYENQANNYTADLGLSINQIMQKYGIDQDAAVKRLAIAKQGSNKASAPADTGPIFGGEAP